MHTRGGSPAPMLVFTAPAAGPTFNFVRCRVSRSAAKPDGACEGPPMPISARNERGAFGPGRADLLDVPLLLGNRDLPASNGGAFERLSPMTGEVVSRAAAATAADAAAAVAS